MQSESILTPDTQAVLLLCGELGQRNGDSNLKPLSARHYNVLAAWLKAEGLRPGDLLTREGRARLQALQTAEVNSDRFGALLERGAALALTVEKWQRSGLWVISRSDDCYPDRLKQYLGQSAPPLLYGVGSKDLLSRGGLAVVGSRDRSEEDAEFARRVGEHCAQEEIALISGAAKGIDRDAMSGSLEAGGSALGVLAEGLSKTATSGQYRSGLVSDRLTLVSPYDPDSRWFAYTAMDRNKLLYGFSSATLVVASAAETGGTWAGATEALRLGRVAVFVKATGVVAPGNPKLLRLGAIPFPEEPWGSFTQLFDAKYEKNGHLFSDVQPEPPNVSEHPAPVEMPPVADEDAALKPVPPAVPAVTEPERDAYTRVIDDMIAILRQPQSEASLASAMNVRAAQMKDWLERAAREGRVKKLKKPVRYVAEQSPGLFAV